ncbi:sensor histidine kinase [Novispirillum sp. DQ9]|uniref:sensor histidine kinase n=1 Tax=Novispirillum sp. DQ9 TaxID=3398612 RepID=UPI003C7E5C28
MRLRGKLILLFVAIKVIPLILLGWLAWQQASSLGAALTGQAARLLDFAKGAVTQVGETAIADAVAALDERAREDIERQTTDTARAVADFLYDRDGDILLAAALEPDEAVYRSFLESRRRMVIDPGAWELASDKTHWQRTVPRDDLAQPVSWGRADNAKQFSYRAPDQFTTSRRPLYLEMTFVGLDGREKVKVTTSDRTRPDLVDVSDRANTFVKAETYFSALSGLGAGAIHVSDVIGAYVGSRVIGTYTPASADKAGIAFEPEESAYAGKENPVGQRFKGLIRWATPVVRDGRTIGWVTLALDHDHLMSFTDHIVPTAERYSDIGDPGSGNYAFIWDAKGRSIVHPRHHSIVGYDPETGEPAVPWLEAGLFKEWQDSGLGIADFLAQAPQFREQGLDKKPALPLTKAGMLGLDCRFLNFAPQCSGWYNLTQHGGSGSFAILWSGLWKLTTAAAIPYYTGQYGASARGFGFVTIGANIDEFHRPANESKQRLDAVVAGAEAEMGRLAEVVQAAIKGNLSETASRLSASTAVMVAVVILIAVWMASHVSGRIAWLVNGISRFRSGERAYRFESKGRDEIASLAGSFNEMADTLDANFTRLEEEIASRDKARREAEAANRAKSQFLSSMSHELRTPLNAILGFAQLLEQGRKEPLSDRQRKQVRRIIDGGDHLLAIITDILDFAKIETGKLALTREAVDSKALVEDVVATARTLAAAREVTVLVDIEAGAMPALRGDPTRCRQVLLNLLSNAVKYNRAGGRVTLSAAWNVATLCVAVSDTGMGIPADRQGEVFQPFSRLGRENSAIEGTGIGLSITRQLVEQMGGRIGFSSVEGEGSTFWVEFPLAGADAAPEPRPAAIAE